MAAEVPSSKRRAGGRSLCQSQSRIASQGRRGRSRKSSPSQKDKLCHEAQVETNGKKLKSQVARRQTVDHEDNSIKTTPEWCHPPNRSRCEEVRIGFYSSVLASPELSPCCYKSIPSRRSPQHEKLTKPSWIKSKGILFRFGLSGGAYVFRANLRRASPSRLFFLPLLLLRVSCPRTYVDPPTSPGLFSRATTTNLGQNFDSSDSEIMLCTVQLSDYFAQNNF